MTAWHYSDDARRQHGPCPADELHRLYRERRIGRDTLVWREGLAGWVALERVAAELGLEALVPDPALPPPLPPATRAPAPAATTARTGMSGCLIAVLVCAGLGVPMAGILAAIALPAYQDYTVRAKVMAVVAATTELKAAIDGYAAAHDACPAGDSAELAAPIRQLGQHAQVAAVRVGTLQSGACAFELALRNTGAQADGKALLFEMRRGDPGAGWECGGGDLAARYRPSQCRAPR